MIIYHFILFPSVGPEVLEADSVPVLSVVTGVKAPAVSRSRSLGPVSGSLPMAKGTLQMSLKPEITLGPAQAQALKG